MIGFALVASSDMRSAPGSSREALTPRIGDADGAALTSIRR